MPPPVKVILLILAGIFRWIATKPPHRPPIKADRVLDRRTLFEKSHRKLGMFVQAIGIGSLMIESAMLLALYFGSPPGSQALVAISVGMVYTGALIRLWCYKTLGTLFTYVLTIRPDHKLITSGPYAIVRHPSYTGSALMITGMILAVLCPHGYVRECGLMSTPVVGVFLVWAMGMGYTMVSLLGRGSFEDAALKKEFGVSWEAYRRAVPCRFIPGVV
ncbi:hypothetical protein JB92DRAFT_2822143 [Gautieria morchelliformis]|nr:hypothetical protein JB92DRAFT_2822143 [Gautieria morchelliformis]